MTRNANPSINPANTRTLTGLLRQAFTKLMQGVDTMLPAQVIQYIPGPPAKVQVQALIPVVNTNGVSFTLGQIASIPVLQLGGGNFLLHFDLIPGDFGWIEACDRDISLFLQTYQESSPSTFRTHNFSDSRFIPDVMTGYTISDDDAGKALFQSKDGTVKIALSLTDIEITAPKIVVTATSSDPFPIRINGDVYVTGNISASEAITPDAPPP